MDLPRGLFWIGSASGMSEPYVNSLLKACGDLYRRVLVLTDLPISFDSTDIVTINEDPEGMFDYCFITDSSSEMSSLHDRFVPSIRGLGWRCWMAPRINDPIPWRDAERASRDILSTHEFDAVCQPSVSTNLGPNRDVIFSRSGVVSSVMSPNSGDGFWREIFRSSGFYGAKAKLVRGEI